MPTTQMSLVHAAQQSDAPDVARAALGEIGARYWKPIYCYVQRKSRCSASDARELTQAFVMGVLENGISSFDPSYNEGDVRFRDWFCGRLNRFLSNALTAERRDLLRSVPWDQLAPAQQKAVDSQSAAPDHEFDRSFASLLIGRAMHLTEQQYAKAGQGDRFRKLETCLVGREYAERDYAVRASELGISVGATRFAVFTMRRRLYQHVDALVRRMVSSEEKAREEYRLLFPNARRQYGE